MNEVISRALSVIERLPISNSSQRQVTPSWVQIAEGLLTFLTDAKLRPSEKISIADNVATPIVRFAAQELWHQRLGERSALLSHATKVTWENSLRKHLSSQAERLVDWEIREINAFKHSVTQLGTDAKTLKRLFNGSIEPVTLRLVQKYPALLRLWSRQIENWWSFVPDFLDGVERFVASGWATKPQAQHIIRRLKTGLSDPHNGNRTVLSVQFSDGQKWFYKPRCGSHELSWFRLLEWLNAQGFPAPFRIVPVVCYQGHCWMQAIPVRPVSSARDASSYYFRAGALLYLAHILRAVDFHAGNLIASGPQPVLIDCETLLHPNTRVPSAVRWQGKGIIRTGLLPLNASTEAAQETSAFGRFVPGDYLLRINGRPASAHEFTTSLSAGFRTMHDFLRKRGLSRADLNSLLKLDSTRRIYRPTSLYAEILRRSYSPGTMKTGLERNLFIQAACRDGLLPHLCLEKEVAALEDGDIPVFFGRPSAPRALLSERSVSRSLLDLKISLCVAATNAKSTATLFHHQTLVDPTADLFCREAG